MDLKVLALPFFALLMLAEAIFTAARGHDVYTLHDLGGSNPEYIDKNYANFLIIWDRLFGTFEPEVASVRCGLINNINTFNPLKIAFTEWYKLLRDTLKASSLGGVGQLWTRPPGWKPEQVEAGEAAAI